MTGKKKVVQEIKGAAETVDSTYLATDPDREGEAISWHVIQAANLDGKSLHRVVFHEITAEAVKEAFRHPRTLAYARSRTGSTALASSLLERMRSMFLLFSLAITGYIMSWSEFMRTYLSEARYWDRSSHGP